jgi:hypothetical protein
MRQRQQGSDRSWVEGGAHTVRRGVPRGVSEAGLDAPPVERCVSCAFRAPVQNEPRAQRRELRRAGGRGQVQRQGRGERGRRAREHQLCCARQRNLGLGAPREPRAGGARRPEARPREGGARGARGRRGEREALAALVQRKGEPDRPVPRLRTKMGRTAAAARARAVSWARGRGLGGEREGKDARRM